MISDRQLRYVFSAIVALALAVIGGCESGFQRIDREVDELLAEGADEVGAEVGPIHRTADLDETEIKSDRDPTDERPPTVNPPAAALSFTAAGTEDAENVLQRLRAYSEPPGTATTLDLAGALQYAVRNSREFKFAEEEYVLACLRLLVERHLWGPRFFNDVTASVEGEGDSGLYDTSLRLVNDFRVTQRLPYGGEVSVRALAQATEDLHLRVAGENVQSADLILAAEIPLLRGAGDVARENLIQTERDLIYEARAFERFRREFLFSIASDYLDLIVDLQRIENSRMNLESFQRLERQQKALNEAGRNTRFELAEAENNTIEAEDRLNADAESHRLALDRFKVRIGMPVEQTLNIVNDSLGLPTPKTTLDEAVYAGLSYRLDLQTRRDQLEDADRNVEIARNALLGDLDVFASIEIPTDDEKDRAGLQFSPNDSDFQAGITYGLPLDREVERLSLRQAQISLARAHREYDRFRDDIATNVRAAVRGIDSALFSLQIQEANVEIAELREEAIEVDPARASITQKTDAIDQTVRARDARDESRRDLEVAVLGYLLATGQLRVDENGFIKPLHGMDVSGLPGEGGAAPEEDDTSSG